MISIIVPIYNTQKYLWKCVDSIIDQTYADLEIILVNDGSTDDSLSICRDYVQKDQRIKIVDKNNGGLSSARNAGLDAATGEFISFIDSDDYLELDAFAHLIEVQEKTKADIVRMNACHVDQNYNCLSTKIESFEHIETLSASDFIKKICLRERGCSVCGALFKTEIFSKIRFKEGRLNEDFLFWGNAVIDGVFHDIVLTSYCGYNYYTRTSSITHQPGLKQSLVDAVQNCCDLKCKTVSRYPELVPYIAFNLVYQIRTALLCMSLQDYSSYRILTVSYKKLIKDNLSFFANLNSSWKDMKFCEAYIKAPFFTILLYKIYSKVFCCD